MCQDERFFRFDLNLAALAGITDVCIKLHLPIIYTTVVTFWFAVINRHIPKYSDKLPKELKFYLGFTSSNTDK